MIPNTGNMVLRTYIFDSRAVDKLDGLLEV